MWTATGIASAELPTAVRAAAYLGGDELVETSLPATLSDGESEHPVTWTLDADAFDEAWATVEVPGTVDGQAVTAHVEVIPPAEYPLVYFVDAGHGGDSQTAAWSTLETNSHAYNAVSSLATDLHNTKPDQRFVDGSTDWGFAYGTGSYNYKLTVEGGDPNASNLAALGEYDKFSLGARTNETFIGHKLALDPGTYTLSSGFREFYTGNQSRSRGITPTVSWNLDGVEQSQAMAAVAVETPANQPGATVTAHDVFTIPEGATDVALTYRRSSGENPMFSWFAVAAGDARDALAGEPEPPVVPTTEVTIDAADIAADNVNGLTFKGFGVLSANSTSSVLMDYKAQHPEKYDELLQTLFGGENPVMNHVKIEMGNDRNNSTGSDPATMRRADEEANVLRHPGFQLAADASKYNPDLVVSILRWVAPAWVTTEDDTYLWYKNTILAAHREYGFMVDYLNPGVNEHSADLNITKQWYDRIQGDETGYVSDDPSLAGFRDGEAELFRQIKLVISDEVGTGTFGPAMVTDADLRAKVDVAAFHYNTNDDSQNSFKRLATEFDKQVWNSEAQATFSNSAFRPNNNVADPTVPGTGIGGTGSSLEMANTIVKGFVNSHRTHVIYQPAIGSFYEGGQYSFKELVSARDPWSGWLHYDAGLAVLQHFSSFAVTGWENADNTAGVWRAVPEASRTTATGTNPIVGRNGEPNYMTLAAPDASDFSTVIVNDSENPRSYVITPVGFGFGAEQQLSVWETRAADEGHAFDANYKRFVGDVAAEAGAYTVLVQPFSIVTVTSLDATTDDGWTTPLPVPGERTVLESDADAGVLWADDFNYEGKTVPVLADGGGLGTATESFIDSRGGVTGFTPLYNWDRQGSFEGYEASDGQFVLRQQLDRQTTGVPGAWNGSDPITGIGDRRWSNYEASIDVRFERSEVAGNYGALGVRGRGTSGAGGIDTTPYALRLNEDGSWQFLRRNAVVGSGIVADDDWDSSTWHRLAVRAAGADVSASIDGVGVFSFTDTNPYLAGFVDVASGFHNTQFDNLRVEHVDGYLPYYGEHLDNMEMHDLAEVPAAKLVYDGQWRHANGGGMHEFQRSRSTSLATGAGVSHTFTGSGIDLIAGSGYGSATFDVHVDGELLVQNAATQPTDWFQASYSLRGLEWGEHTVRFEVTSGALAIDAVGVMSAPAIEAASADGIVAPLADAKALERTDDFTDESWALLQRLISDAEAAVADPAAYGLDGEGARQIVDRLVAASNPKLAEVVSVETPHLATWQGDAPTLPETLTATLSDGSTMELEIDWDQTAASDFGTAWSVVAVAGAHGPVEVSARVEVVPEGTVAFADVQASSAGQLGYDSPAWVAIDELVGGLVNDLPDQQLTSGTTWGHAARNAAGTSDIQRKGVVAGPYDKTTTTGMYTANQVGAQLDYTLDLEAGSYTIVGASHSWWPDYARTANVSVLHDGGSTPAGTVTLNTANPTELLSQDIVLAETGQVTLRLTATTNESPMLSWVAAVRTPTTEPTPDPSVEPSEDPSVEPSEDPSVEPSEDPSVEPSATPSQPSATPSQEPSATPSQGPSPTPTVTVTRTPNPHPGDIYTIPGFHNYNGRLWHTQCEPYSQTIRCRTEIWATTVKVESGRFVQSNGWVFNNLTYLPFMTRSQWASNPLGHAGEWTAADGRRWRTECDTAATGRNGCRSYTMTSLVVGSQNSAGVWSYRVTQDWVFNNLVRFRTN
ncbi:hypothetical protein FOJ82_11505 [Tessaracoccus rhinocerotis]|uniref:Uncharacterized protein n=1 Tax=Tessaracoccus rhinocerotis TaxID=1689449 RepID=A0A553JZK7_9ACTN|nr:Ig-like domain-containing protein [Tessaracoccus rhinocerotis]TRY17883.1 hypothetical protein FOJ82_11505 [Tessaracoccus rhinocerotis]